MNKLLKLGIFSILLSPHWLYAQDYKCFVDLAGGKQEIALVKLTSTEWSRDAKNKLLLNGIFAKDGVSKLKVAKVHECVPFTSRFISRAAQKLEKKSVF